MIVDGRGIADRLLARVRAQTDLWPEPTRVVAYVAPDETPATRSYLKIKEKTAKEAGCSFGVVRSLDFPKDADAVIVQLPLPEGVDAKAVCDSIPLEKDADVLSGAARKNFEMEEEGALLPPVVGAVKEIFESGNVETQSKKAVVIGAGFLVGAPVATWLRQEGALVEVFTVESDSEALSASLRAADIIVCGVGSPHLVKPGMIKEGVVLIDAGTSESSGKVVGDADPACAATCSLFTPVPGGVGPIAVAKLFENAVTLAEARK